MFTQIYLECCPCPFFKVTNCDLKESVASLDIMISYFYPSPALPIQTSIRQCLLHMRRIDFHGIGKIGYRSGKFEYLEISTGRKIKFLHRFFQQFLRLRRYLAIHVTMSFLHLPVTVDCLLVSEPLLLNLSCFLHSCADISTCFPSLIFKQFFMAQR